MAKRRYTVQFRTEPGHFDEARDALHAAGIQLVSGHGGVSHGAPGGNLPEVSTHSGPRVRKSDADRAA